MLIHTDIKLRATYFGLNFVVKSILCQLHCRRLVFDRFIKHVWVLSRFEKGLVGD
jgi:hypothetical protein